MIIPVLCMADNFDYDEDAKVEISDDNWGDGKHDVNIGFEENSTAIKTVNADGNSGRPTVAIEAGRLVITAERDMTIAVYSLNCPVPRFINAAAGRTTLELPHGIYIVMGRKYLL